MNKIIKKDIWLVAHSPYFWVFGITSIILIVASFIVPPTGVIHPSVLTATGELFAFASLGAVYKAIDNGVDAKIEHGNTSIILNNDNDNDDNNEVDKENQ